MASPGKPQGSAVTLAIDGSSAESSTKISLTRLIFDAGVLTPEVLTYQWRGEGTLQSPYLVSWITNDSRNPMNLSSQHRWLITAVSSLSCFSIAFTSSVYTGGLHEIMAEFNVSNTTAQLGVSLFVLGFAVGPLFWAPLSEIYGRQVLFILTFGAFVACNAASAGSNTIVQLLVFRFLAGVFGSSPLTNAGGVIADQFQADDRGLAMTLFSCGPFLGPVLGPIVGGFLGQHAGWRWNLYLTVIFCGTIWIANTVLTPETFAPILLQKRAKALSKRLGKVYISHLEEKQGKKKLSHILKVGLSRPWALLFFEPIVLILSIYMAVVYATMYILFAAYPIIFQQGRGWDSSMSGLAFIGMAVGMIAAVAWMLFENKLYNKRATSCPGGRAPPEARLPPSLYASVLTPVGLFWFAWTNSPSIHWSVCLIGTASFGCGTVLLYLSVMNYLVDSYVLYAASCLAGSSILRSVLGAVLPLFTAKMYHNLEIHWASSIPAFLALACLPFPFIFVKYGATIRQRCTFAAEAEKVMEKIMDTRQRTLEQITEA